MQVESGHPDATIRSIREDMTKAQVNLVIGIPVRTDKEPIFTDLRKLVMPHGMKSKIEFAIGMKHNDARNFLVDRALDLRADYLLMIDNDIVLPPEGILRLYNSGKEVISGVCYHKREDKIPCFSAIDSLHRHFIPDVSSENTLVECNWVIPAGAIWIKMSVFNMLQRPYFFMTYLPDGKIEIGEDCYFTRKCNNQGYKTWLHTGVKCGHTDGYKIYYGDSSIPW